MTVKRYRAVASAAISLSDSGEYVKYEDYAALQAQVNALAVECGIMRQLLPDYVSVPATDAAIREIKAQGICDFIDKELKSACLSHGWNTSSSAYAVSCMLEDYIKNIRNGEVE